MLMDGGNSVIDQQEKDNKEKKTMNEAINDKVDKVVDDQVVDRLIEGILFGVVLTCFILVCAGLIGFLFGLKTQKQIEKEMVARGFGFYTCNDKTGEEVKFEYYKLEDVDVITDKVYNEKKVK